MSAAERAWAAAVQAALLGTGRPAPEAEPVPGALGRALDAVAGRPAEPRLLARAALLAAYRAAGAVPPRGVAPLPPAAPADDAPAAPAAAARVLHTAVAGTTPELVAEWMERARAARVVPPPELLPAVLDFGRRHPAVRDAVAEGIGTRGCWLAARNPEWSYAAAPADPHAAWETGDAPARARALRALRRHDPATARDLLLAGWDATPPRDRAALVEALEEGLSMADEPFLEAALDDRRKEVRAAAAALLRRLPQSRLVARMTERALPLLHLDAPEGVLARLRGGAAVRVELPSELDAAARRDGIDPRAPGATGERAWWLRQMLAAVPPSVWSTRWGVDAAACVAAARPSPDARLLVGAWAQAAVHTGDATWAEALLRGLADDEWIFVRVLAPVLPPARGDALATGWLRADGALAPGSRTAELLGALPGPWSAALTEGVLTRLPRDHPQAGWLRELLRGFAPRMDAAAAVRVLERDGDPLGGAWADLLHLRHTLHQALPG